MCSPERENESQISRFDLRKTSDGRNQAQEISNLESEVRGTATPFNQPGAGM
jgi:hypothetical protein